MADIFSDEWLKSSVATKRKSLATTSNLEQLYVLILIEGQSLKDKLDYEVNELGLNPIFCIDNVEAKRFLNKYGSKVIMVISSFDLSDPLGRSFRELVLENTNDTPFAILTDLNAFEIDNSNNLTEAGYDLTPHMYMPKNLPQEIWYNFLRFDVLTRISLLGEEVKLRGAFIQNSENIIQNIEELVLGLENNPDPEKLDTIFGNVHTLKGGSSFLQPKNLEKFMHKFEDLINKLRSGELAMNSEIITAMLKILDKSKELIEDLSAHFHHEYEEGELAAYFSAWVVPTSPSPTAATTDDKTLLIINSNTLSGMSSQSVIPNPMEPNIAAESDVTTPTALETTATPPMVDSTITKPVESKVETENVPDPVVSVIVESLSPSPVISVKKENLGDSNSQSQALPPPPNPKKKDDKNLRVPISLLDTLMHISGELTVVRNMINKIDRSLKVRYSGDRELERMSSLLEELHKLNGSLQTHILDLRKVPVKEIVAPLNRVVRDLSKQLDKIVTLKVQGSELRIDTAIAEILNNTLIHIVRNSIDHGLEPPKERENQGKPQGGNLYLDAFEENDNVYVRIRDDGRGLQTEKIRSRAIERGLLTEEQALALKEEDVWPLIFAPGFSTAEKVTDISGRGIGMSAVKEAVEAIDGEVEISSVLGEGSSITLSMPLPKSVLITRCLFILTSGMQLGIPNENVYRIVHLDGESNTAQLSKVEDTYVLSLEEELIPVVQLDQVLGSSKVETEDVNKTIVVLRSSKGAAIGIIVNDVLEFEDAVVKPFTDHMKAFEIFFGTTFLGDGSIGLIFRVDGLVETYRAKQFYRFNINFKARENFIHDAASAAG